MAIAGKGEPKAPRQIDPAKPIVGIDVEDDGADRALIRWMLSLTPIERLGIAQRWAGLVTRNDRADG